MMHIGNVTTTERTILKGLANGLQSKELANDVGLKVPTIEMYVRRLYARCSAKSRAHLVALAILHGQLSTDDIHRFGS